MSITTKKGDDGTTDLLDSSRVTKFDLRPECYGALDEATAFIGWARAKTSIREIHDALLLIQNHLYLINSELACPPESLDLLSSKLDKRHLEKLESIAQEIESRLQLPRKFVVYGQSEISAILDIARAVVRRAERRLVELNAQQTLTNPYIAAYINRLSDALFLFARFEESSHRIPFAHPDSTI